MKNKTIEVPSETGNNEKYLKTNPKIGLVHEEVLRRQKIFGFNELKKAKTRNFIAIFFSQLKDLMALLLLFAGFSALALAFWFQFGRGESEILTFIQASIIIGIVFLNALFGAIQEHRSSTAVEQLQKISSQKTKVLRNKILTIIDSKQIVVGDIIVIEAGDSITADSRLLESSNLKCVESALTGESLPVVKDHEEISNLDSPIGDRKNWIFSGCTTINGRATAIVEKIGNDTEIGKVAKLLNNKDNLKTPLQHKLHRLGKYLGIFGIIITLISFIFSILVVEGLAFTTADNFKVFLNAFPPSLILAISLATAAIPEGLGTVVNIILSIGVKRMSEKNGLIKKLPAVETLGSTAVICSDKTGTLTLNKMTVVRMWTPFSNTETIPNNKLTKHEFDFLKYATLCTDCVIEDEKGKKRTVIGDPTEIAIVELALKKGFDDDKWDADNIRIADIPFDSDRKMMTSVNKIGNKQIVIVKGAPDVIFEKCKNFDKSIAKKIYDKWADKAIRVIAVGYKEFHGDIPDDIKSEQFENDLLFMGLIGMIDPPRKEVKSSIEQCAAAGIKPVMITGDHLNTAIAIATNLGIYKEKDLAITGVELDKISNEVLKKTIHMYSVFARVSPENKIRIVKAWQSIDQVVAMTGDGVNDAPALQAADIGCAMGITGTDVSKGAADMVLTDDNFATIVSSVKSGRGIYENIRRVIKFLLSSNLASIISIVLGMIIFFFVFSDQIGGWGAINVNNYGDLLTPAENSIINNVINDRIGFQTTITTIQILLTNIIIDTIPGIALGTQRTTNDLMKVRPRSKYESVFADGLIKKIIISGIVSGFATIFAFLLGAYFAILQNTPGLRFYYGTVAAFIALALGGVFKSISISSNKSIFKTKWLNNRWVYIACIPSIAIIAFATLIPQISFIFGEAVSLNEVEVFLRTDISQEIINKLDMNNINAILFGNKNKNTIVSYEVFLVAITFSLIPFIALEIEKEIISLFFKKSTELKITEFKIIPRPISKFQKNNIKKLWVNS